MQLKELLQRGGTIDWAGQSGYDAFSTLFKTAAPTEARFSLREAQLSGERAAVAVELARGRDVAFVGSLANRAIGEGFHKMGSAVLEEHKLEVDAAGRTLLMHATLNGWDSLVKHLVYLDGVDIGARNRAGQTAIELAVAQVRRQRGGAFTREPCTDPPCPASAVRVLRATAHMPRPWCSSAHSW